jgi:hypothetical protein
LSLTIHYIALNIHDIIYNVLILQQNDQDYL